MGYGGVNSGDGSRHAPPGARDRGDTVDALPDALLVRSFAETTAVDRTSGAERWRVPYDVTARPGGLVVQRSAAGDTKTHGVADPATGAPRRTQDDPLSTDAHAPGDAYVRTAAVESGTDTVTLDDLATGAPRWTVPVPEIGRATVARLDPDTLLVSGDGSRGSVALAVADGRQLWTTPTALVTPVRLDGAPLVVGFPERRSVVVADGRTGKTREATLRSTGRTVGAAVYTTDRGEVTATGLRDLRELWRVPVGDVTDVDAVAGGFVAVVGRSGTRRLVGYLA